MSAPADEDVFTGYAAIGEIMKVYKVSRSYAYKMASVDHWRRYRHPDGGVRYRRTDVDATFNRAPACVQVRAKVKSSLDHGEV